MNNHNEDKCATCRRILKFGAMDLRLMMEPGITTCPGCNGYGDNLVYINTGPDSSGHRWEMMKCFRCNGKGTISREESDAIIEGKYFELLRQRAGFTLQDAARKLGLSPADVNAVERGRINATNAAAFNEYKRYAPWLDACRNATRAEK